MSEDLSADIDDLAGDDDSGEGDSDEGGSSKKKLLIILVPVILLLGGGAAAFFTGALDGLLGKGEVTAEQGDDHGEDAHGGDDGHGASADDHGSSDDGHGASDDGHGGSSKTGGVVFLEIPKMIVSLSSDDDQPRYLSLSVQLELESNADKSSVQAVMPRVVDQFQTFLRELRVQDLRGTKGLYRLKLELLGRVNAAAYPVEVKNILLQDMIVQ
jgi:flagellar FliL protein